MNEQTVAIGALGRVINLSDRRIQQLVKEGVLERHEKGRYPFLSNVKAYVVYLQARTDGGGTVIDLEDARKWKLGAEARLFKNIFIFFAKLLSSPKKNELKLEIFGYPLKPFFSPKIVAGCHSAFHRNSPRIFFT